MSTNAQNYVSYGSTFNVRVTPQRKPQQKLLPEHATPPVWTHAGIHFTTRPFYTIRGNSAYDIVVSMMTRGEHSYDSVGDYMRACLRKVRVECGSEVTLSGKTEAEQCASFLQAYVDHDLANPVDRECRTGYDI